MGSVEKILDVNAHIEDLQCEIDVNGNDAVARISFSNLGYGDITAIKFNAQGYNSFGDIVPVNGKDKFFLIIQNIVIAKNESIMNLKAKLPDANIRKLELEECQICYSDGSVVSYEGENRFAFELETIDNQEQLSALHKLYDEKAMFKLKDYYAKGWVCSCGRYNSYNAVDCSLCGKLKARTETICSDENRNILLEEYRISEEKDREIREEERKKSEKERWKRRILIGVIAAVCIVLARPVLNVVQISQRTTYQSESDMKKALRGVWTHYDDEYREELKINIRGYDLVKRWVSLGSDSDMELEIREWNPEQGTFTISLGTYTVLKNGNIKDEDGNEFEKGGDWEYIDSGI